jgi:hypothetical protein
MSSDELLLLQSLRIWPSSLFQFTLSFLDYESYKQLVGLDELGGGPSQSALMSF